MSLPGARHRKPRPSADLSAVFPPLPRLPCRLIIPGMKHDARAYAEQYYAGSTRSLAEDLAATAGNPHGVVLFSPALVALLQPCRSTQAEPWRHWGQPTPPSLADAWYVHLLVGELALARRMAALLPSLPWVVFQRGVRGPALRRYPWQRFLLPSHCTTINRTFDIMGFFSTPSIDVPSAATVAEETIPVTTETASDSTAEAYAQSTANKRGLLSTILSKPRGGRLSAPAADNKNNTTLG